MTTPLLKIAVNQKPKLSGKMDVRFPANVSVSEFLTLLKANGNYTFGIDYTIIGLGNISDPTTSMVVVLDETTGTYKLISLSSLIASTSQIVQNITAAGPVAVSNNAGIVKVNQTVGAAITLTMPLASAKTCPVLISDWKGDAGTNNITINASGSDTFPGGLTSVKIAANRGSLSLSPIAGAGYAW